MKIFIDCIFDRSLINTLLLLVTYAVFSQERFTMVTAYRGFVTKLQLLETLFTQHWSFSKPRRRQRRERRQTKGLMSKTIAVHVHFESLYISLPSSAKQQREVIKFYVFWRTRTTMANFWYLRLE